MGLVAEQECQKENRSLLTVTKEGARSIRSSTRFLSKLKLASLLYFMFERTGRHAEVNKLLAKVSARTLVIGRCIDVASILC